MAKKNVSQAIHRQKKPAEQPVSEGIRRAAKRAGIPVADAMAEVSKAMDARVEALAVLDEVVALRKLVQLAEDCFQSEGYPSPSPTNILTEAIRCAKEDFELICDASESAIGTPEAMVFRRAEYRLDLALALADYRERFGRDGKAVTL